MDELIDEALGSLPRQLILAALAKKPRGMRSSAIRTATGLSPATVDRNLRALADLRLVEIDRPWADVKRGVNLTYLLDRQRYQEVLDAWLERQKLETN